MDEVQQNELFHVDTAKSLKISGNNFWAIDFFKQRCISFNDLSIAPHTIREFHRP